jgi:hypothetical protein
MTKTPNPSPRDARRSWLFGRSALHLYMVAAFACIALWFSWDPIEAQERSAKKARDEAHSGFATEVSLTAGKKIDAQALAQLIDQQIEKRLQSEGVKAAPRSEDGEFLRRVYLDLVGVIPPPEKVQAFLDSKEPNKRAAVIDELLKDPRFGKQQAEIWGGQLLPHDSNNRRLSEAPFVKWLSEHFNSDQPLNKLVYDLLSATGTQDENGAVTFYVANPSVDKMTDHVTRMFMGVQLQCAQCHNHPFTDYKQTEYWGMAAFFMKTRLTANPQQAAKKGISPGITESGKAKGKKGNLPESAKIVPAKFLRGEQPNLSGAEAYRPVVAQWITAPENPFFARAMVNRFWYQLFGRGIVTPVDDMHADNVPAHPEILGTLTEQFKLHDFDLKYLLRAICNSEAYQRSSQTTAANPQAPESVDPDLYAKRLVRTLTPEQLYDSLTSALRSTEGRGEGRGKGAPIQRKGPGGPREAFLTFFRVEDPNPLDYQSGIPQTLRLMNSGMANNLNAAVASAMSANPQTDKVIERLYLTALSRRPSVEETRRMMEYASRQSDARAAYGDILWALLNTSEFVLNH